MAIEYKLPFTGAEIKTKLEKVSDLDNQLSNLKVPTKTSDLTNDSSFATEEYVNNALDDTVFHADTSINTPAEVEAALEAGKRVTIKHEDITYTNPIISYFDNSMRVYAFTIEKSIDITYLRFLCELNEKNWTTYQTELMDRSFLSQFLGFHILSTSENTPLSVAEMIFDGLKVAIRDEDTGIIFTSYNQLDESTVVFSFPTVIGGESAVIQLMANLETDTWEPVQVVPLSGGGGLGSLVGTTDEITPTQVAEALNEGKNVILTHTEIDAVVSGFVMMSGMVIGSSVVAVDGAWLVGSLVGDADDNWNFSMSPLSTPIISTTDDMTPAQVLEYVKAGVPVTLTHTVNGGEGTFSNFFISGNVYVVASSVIKLGPMQVYMSLVGMVADDEWRLEYGDFGADTFEASINGHTLKNNYSVNLIASDVGALPDTTKIPTKVSELENDTGYVTSIESALVTSVNNKTGDIQLTASDVGALSDTFKNRLIGVNTTASGAHSHAQGQSTTASGVASHAEGLDTTASGSYSHAEGRVRLLLVLHLMQKVGVRLLQEVIPTQKALIQLLLTMHLMLKVNTI